jgi:hypothetical protein
MRLAVTGANLRSAVLHLPRRRRSHAVLQLVFAISFTSCDSPQLLSIIAQGLDLDQVHLTGIGLNVRYKCEVGTCSILATAGSYSA